MQQHVGSIRPQPPFHVDQPNLYGSSPSVPPNQTECDPELSDILNIYIELEHQSRNNIATQQQQQQDEAIAITEITKSLIECEKAVGCTVSRYVKTHDLIT